GGLDQMIRKLIKGEKEGELTAVKKFYYIAGGVEKLVEKLKNGVESRGGELRVIRRVKSLKQFRTGHLQITAENQETGADETYQAEDVISTIPLPELVEMLQPQFPNQAVQRSTNELRYIENI